MLFSNTSDKASKLSTLLGKDIKSWKVESIYPKILGIDLTSFCDSSCINCIEGQYKTKKAKEVDFNKLSKIISYASRFFKGIELAGGEPSTYSKFKEFLETTYAYKIPLYMISNGHWPDGMNNIVYEAFSVQGSLLRFSVNASANFYSKIYNNKNGKEIYRNVISKINQFSKVLNTKVSIVFRSYILCELEEIIRDIPVRVEIVILAERNKRKRVKPLNSDISHLLVTALSKYPNVVMDEYLLNYQTNQSKNYEVCPTMLLKLLLSPMLDILPCTYHRTIRFEKLDTNDIEGSIERYRHKILEGKFKPSKHCQFECSRHEMNLFITQSKKNNEFKKIALKDFWI